VELYLISKADKDKLVIMEEDSEEFKKEIHEYKNIYNLGNEMLCVYYLATIDHEGFVIIAGILGFKNPRTIRTMLEARMEIFGVSTMKDFVVQFKKHYGHITPEMIAKMVAIIKITEKTAGISYMPNKMS
jgi:hypothetical protein